MTHICQWIGSPFVQIMACHLFGVKPLSKLMLGHCQLDLLEQTTVKFSIKVQNFSFRKMHMKIWISSVKWQPFCPGEDEFTVLLYLKIVSAKWWPSYSGFNLCVWGREKVGWILLRKLLKYFHIYIWTNFQRNFNQTTVWLYLKTVSPDQCPHYSGVNLCVWGRQTEWAEFYWGNIRMFSYFCDHFSTLTWCR